MSVFRDSLVFFDQMGLYDVVLPFLLIFTITFGVLEKSKIFGTVPFDGKQIPRKNLNAMVAFCTGFFVVASAQLVALINGFVAQVALILVILIMFMILVASMHKEQKDGFSLFDLHKNWAKFFVFIVFIAIVLIFLANVGWLGPLWAYVTVNWNQELVGTIALFALVAGFIWFITDTKDDKKDSKG
jgi:hypothetical protein